MELYETLYTDAIANCEPDDLIEFPWIDEFGDEMVDTVRVISIDVDTTVVMRGTSEVTGDTTTYELDPDLMVRVLGG